MKTFGKYLEEKNKGLWDNIHAKRKRGEKMRKPGSKGAPTDADFKRSQEESVEAKKYTAPTQAEIDADRKKNQSGKSRPSMSLKSIKNKQYAGMSGDLKKESVEEKKLTAAELKKREEIAKAMERDNPGMDMSKKMAIATATAKKVAEETQLDEISKKTLSSYVKKASRDVANRSADNARDYARGDRPVGLNKKSMKNWRREIGIDKAVDKMTQEAVASADKKPEKYVKPDGKVGVRMVRVNKNIVDKDA